MKRVGSKKKIILPIILVLTGAVLTTSLVVYNNLTSVSADATFDGINKIIDEKTKDGSTDDTFNIVEVVPDKSMASFGYLIDGQEPDLGTEGLSAICKNDGTGSKARKEYMDSVKKRLSSIIDDSEAANTKPLYADGDYEESYINPDENADGSVKEDSEWKKIELADSETIKAGTSGYTIENVGEGKGDFKKGIVFEPAINDDGNYVGDYEQNVEHYIYVGDKKDKNGNLSGGYYNLQFKASSATINKDYFLQKDESGNYIHKAYKFVKADLLGGYGKKYNVQEAIDQKKNLNIFALRNGVYVYIGNTADYTDVWNTDSKYFPDDNEAQVYYEQVRYEYVIPEDIQNDQQYYEVDDSSIQFCVNKNGSYSGILDENEPYIKCKGSDGNEQNGHFRKKDNGNIYSFVGNKEGEYSLKRSNENTTLDANVLVNSVYVKTGLNNREWFRKYVFNNNKKINFKVITVTPQELNSMSLDKINLLYLSESGIDGEKDISYNNSNDITIEVAKNICQQISSDNKKLPVILDYGKVKNCKDFYKGPNMYKLMGALSCRNSKLTKNTDGNDIYNGHYMNLDTLYSLNFNYNALLFSEEKDYPNGFLNGNAVYVVPSNTIGDMPFIMKNFTSPLTQSKDTDTDKKFQEDLFNIGFGEIAEYINSENTLLKKQNQELIHKKISKDVIISYIISYKYKRSIATDKIQSLNILEIEPGRSNGYNKEVNDMYKKVLYYDDLKSWLGKDCPDEKNVTITRMAVTEFIGHIDDLKQYDMIYIGLNIENFNTDSTGKTHYNDSSMDGLVYSNIGDIVVIDPKKYGHAGLLDSDYTDGAKRTSLIDNLPKVTDANYTSAPNTYRASGNDLTKEKVSALEDYLDSGYPIVFSYGFFSRNYESNVNENFIDNSSNMFDFLCHAYESTNAIAVDSSGSAYNLYNVLTSEKPKISLTAPKNSDGKEYAEVSDDKLSLEFGVSTVGTTTEDPKINVELYIDANKDGKFSSIEKLNASNYKLYLNDVETKPQIDSDGNYFNSISLCDKIKLVYDLPHGVNGLISWKLVARLAGSPSRYDFASGFVHEKVVTKEKVNVLQINTSGVSSYNLEEIYKDSSKSHLAGILNDEVKDYEFTIKTVKSDSDELKQICKEGKLKQYNLLIMGYGEYYQIDNLDSDLKPIKEYIEDGNAVLVTYDTTSYYNFDDPNNSKIWGLSFNKNLRDTVGMDRYGVSLADSPLKEGIDVSSENTDKYNTIVNYATSKCKDIAYKPRSNKSTVIKNSQGFTFADLNTFQLQNETYGKYSIYKDVEVGKSDAFNVLLLNRGQIGMYPCQVDASIALTLSSNPHYQLDLNQDCDEDGQTDLVVWFALSNWGSNSGSYEVSAGDARNNYYIYTDGNITYNGMGRSSSINWQQPNELRLFVNTMILAYDAAPHAPELSLKEGYDRNSADVNTIYATLDDAIDQENSSSTADALPEGSETTKDVYFTVTDTNNLKNQVVANTKVHTKFYIECSKEEYNKNKEDKRTLNTGSGTVYLQEVKWNIYSLNNDGSLVEPPISPTENNGNTTIRDFFDNGKTYMIKVPISILPKGSNSIKVYAIAYSEICKQKNGVPKYMNSPEVYKTFDVRRLGLADLD